MTKQTIAILVGGPSTEHQISLISGKSIVQAINKSKYNIVVVGIDHQTDWFVFSENDFLENPDDAKNICLKFSNAQPVFLSKEKGGTWLKTLSGDPLHQIDVVFPVLHGAYGEDGVLQGVLRAANVAFVGVDVLSSSAGMDKDISKRIWRDAGIPIANYFIVERHKKDAISFSEIKDKLGLPLFVKPANAGSSVGVSKVTNEEEYQNALLEGFKYDQKLLVEEAIVGKEVECAILGNEFPEASVIGEIVPQDKFYSYEAKYLNANGALMAIPANIPTEISEKIQKLALTAFQSLGCEGLSRVDFFLTPENEVIINEINTLPGFTSISMYPKLWEATGLPYSELIDKLIELGKDRFDRNNKLLKSKE